ncbi:MAG: Asp-tRNA(Asn)/Glu-tRNA(Gln) amidotransferase subunit GatB [Chrysiogenetes bacterium]|nr:Asp-tRNA(Asn)/Glu-tRNA(Gln) amidotransferase subunit GatB [Chrysiogenetes bacterium]
MSTDFEMVIGLEVHVQLQTKSKLFCGCSTSFGSEPNANTCPVCLGMPGVLPVLNRTAVDYAIRAGLALNCQIRNYSVFSRKNYFYPDLPFGYQISQFDLPVCEHGHIDLEVPTGEGEFAEKHIGITRIHMEIDAGKSLHDSAGDGNASLIDLNRAGVPLIEIVTEPDFRTPAETTEYLRTLRSIIRYLGISDGNMQEGSMRCDANVSVRPRGSDKLGTRAEIKNVNSFKFIEKAILYEASRQEALIRDGKEVVQETRLFDSNAGVTRSMRSKEEAHDYRYFPEPDLMPLQISDKWISDVRESLPELPVAKRERFLKEYGHTQEEAGVLSGDRALAEYFEDVAKHSGDARGSTNWIKNELMRELSNEGHSIEESPISAKDMAGLLALIKDGTISGKIAKDVFAEMYKTSKAPDVIVEEKGLKQIADDSSIRPICEEIVAANPGQVEQYRGGKQALFGFFVGQVMKQTKGKANPKMVNEILKELLDQ